MKRPPKKSGQSYSTREQTSGKKRTHMTNLAEIEAFESAYHDCLVKCFANLVDGIAADSIDEPDRFHRCVKACEKAKQIADSKFSVEADV